MVVAVAMLQGPKAIFVKCKSGTAPDWQLNPHLCNPSTKDLNTSIIVPLVLILSLIPTLAQQELCSSHCAQWVTPAHSSSHHTRIGE